MTDEERISREQLVKRAAVAAGAIYAAPILASSAGAAVNQRCRGKCAGDKKCQARGGDTCCCRNGRCTTDCGECPCQHQGAQCDVAEFCDKSGFCFCYLNGFGQNPGHCIDTTESGDSCQGYQDLYGTCPGGADSECAAGFVCFSSCCESFGFPHLCAPCCGTRGGPATKAGTWGGASASL